MDEKTFKYLMKNYYALVDRVDAHIRDVINALPGEIVCTKGCDDCCRFLTLFPVEAVNIAAGFNRLDTAARECVIRRLETDPEACPLLVDHSCVLYASRPVICRTHGYPIYMEKDGEASVDFCPKNFTGMTAFPKEVLLSVDQLNITLAAVNKQFLESIEGGPELPDRIPVSQALFLFETDA